MTEVKRLPIAFHETFKIEFSNIKSIIEYINNFSNDNGRPITNKELLSSGIIGKNKIKSFVPYSRGTGLINFGDLTLTTFGQHVLRTQSLFDINTIWLCHYFMSAPQGPGPLFWSKAVNDYFISGKYFHSSDISEIISEIYFTDNEKMISESTLASTISIFLNSYLLSENDVLVGSSDNFGKLNLITAYPGNDPTIEVTGQPMRDPFVFAVALSHYWQTVHPNMASLNISDITDSDLARIFFLSPAQAETLLEELRYEGFVEIHRTAPPYQVMLRKTGDWALEQLYGPLDPGQA